MRGEEPAHSVATASNIKHGAPLSWPVTRTAKAVAPRAGRMITLTTSTRGVHASTRPMGSGFAFRVTHARRLSTMAASGADLELALAALPADDRAAVLRLLAAFGFEPDELSACPPLRSCVALLATFRLAAQMPGLPRAEALNEAAAALGLRGDSLLRNWRRWQRAAGQIVSDDVEAA